jgi:putative Ca2+/H+ antiporter (TMEM165/GDT1 family)
MDWQIVAIALGTVFLSELGDKSQLATFSLSSSSSAPRYVFIGACLALLLSSGLGVLVGDRLAEVLPTTPIKMMSALIFALMGLRSLAPNSDKL